VGGTELRSTAQAGRVPDSKKVCFKNGMNTNRYFLWLPCRRAPGLALAEPRTGAVVRRNDGQSERLLRATSARGLTRRDGVAAGRPLAAAVLNPRWWNRSLSRPSAASLAALNAVVAGADLLAEPRTGAVVRQNDGQSERLPRATLASGLVGQKTARSRGSEFAAVEPLAPAAFGRFARGSERGGCGCRSAGRAANGGRRSAERRPE
jgi:hypothetical protein